MKKVLAFLKDNIAFFIIVAISLVFYLIAIFGGDYQTTVFFTEVSHYKFITGIKDGVPLAFFYVIVPIVCLVTIFVLNIFKPKKHDGKISILFVGLFIGFATVAGALLLLIPFALFKDADVSYTQMADWKALSADVYYLKSYNFPLLSMIISLISLIVLGCYASATLSD